MKKLLLLALLISGFSVSTQPFYSNLSFLNALTKVYRQQHIRPVTLQGYVTIENNICNITDFVQVSEDETTKIQDTLKHAKVLINGVSLASGQKNSIPVYDNICTCTIEAPAKNLTPLFPESNFLIKLASRFATMQFIFSFTIDLDTTQEISLLDAFVEKTDLIVEKKSRINFSYRPLFTVRLIVTDIA